MNSPLNLAPILSSNVRSIRRFKGLTQQDLAILANVNLTHIGNIENGRNSPSLDMLAKLASALEVPLWELTLPNSELPKIDQLNALLPYIRHYQKLADQFNINDIFQDNGGKLLQVLCVTGLTNIGNREGNDAKDAEGNEYEIKTVNRRLTKSFSTHHHINPSIIAKYRKVKWLFCVYDNIELVEIYSLEPAQLENAYFTPWEERWHMNNQDINNPKIPLNFIRGNGTLIYQDKADDHL